MSFGIRPPASQSPPTRHVVPSPFTVPRIEKTEKHVEKETPKRPTENHEKRKAKSTEFYDRPTIAPYVSTGLECALRRTTPAVSLGMPEIGPPRSGYRSKADREAVPAEQIRHSKFAAKRCHNTDPPTDSKFNKILSIHV